MNEDTAKADCAQLLVRIEHLESDLDGAFDTINWHMRSNGRLHALLAACANERRAPTQREVESTTEYGMQRAAA